MKKGKKVLDVGTYDCESVDPGPIAERVGQLVAEGTFAKGILVCGTGIGMCMGANEVPRPEGRGISEQLQLFCLMLLIFYVPSYYLRGNFISCGSYKISVVPEFSSPEISLEMRKFHEHFS
ncbi:unnamed protein product [marine sediment metagenome]|uniref:Uncharacterized protein n=1 Tax=marine sediment metagenome TaxID=412755 RepID=X1GDR9_9ZZZZ